MSTLARRRIALLPVLAGVAAASFALRLPGMADDVAAVMPRGNPAQAAESAPATAAPAPSAPAPAAPAGEPAANHDAAASGTEIPASAATDPAPAFDPDKLTPGEIEVLQNLARRREEIEARARELDSREALVAAAEARVDKKLAEIKAIEDKITAAQAQQSVEQDQQLARLVKVYEAMKPADAAMIFNTLDAQVLIDVASRMKEAKIAPVLAAMDPEAAKSLTVALATRRANPPPVPGTGNGG